MIDDFNIPFEWQGHSYNFIAYHGDIYPGNAITLHNYNEGFFIVPNFNIQALRSLKNDEHTLENYRKLGWEIRDKNIIQYDPIPSSKNIGEDDMSPSLYRNGDDKWKRMFVFGAGASSFCSFGSNEYKFSQSSLRPPIGTDIFHERFDELINQFPGVKQIMPLFESRDWDIEVCMQEEWEKAKNSFNPTITSRHVNIQYYLSQLFRSISHEVVENHQRGNLYSLFALKLQSFLRQRKNLKEKIGIVSFNYDTILDQFVESNFGIRFNEMQNYIDWNDNQVVLFKPHGSCNWGWEFLPDKIKPENQSPFQIASYLYDSQTLPAEIYYKMLGNLSNNVYSGAWGLEKSTHPDGLGRFTINKNKIRTFESNERNFFPALLMPYKDKDEFVMPYNHLHALRSYLGHVEELYLIGWKGSEDAFNTYLDSHAKKLKRIIIVNPNGKDVKENLSKKLKLDKYEFEEISSFEEFVCKKMDSMLSENV